MMLQHYDVTQNGKRTLVALIGVGLWQASTSQYVVKVDGRTELTTKDQQEAIKYISDLFEESDE